MTSFLAWSESIQVFAASGNRQTELFQKQHRQRRMARSGSKSAATPRVIRHRRSLTFCAAGNASDRRTTALPLREWYITQLMLGN
jgi:hypothetical protein